ncbi:MAG: hypothetical protein VKL39_07805 [Leptolyngbyaceae bacterium]|nr:hypothetical protein [Leptolyngbyaceae bacterium]
MKTNAHTILSKVPYPQSLIGLPLKQRINRLAAIALYNNTS